MGLVLVALSAGVPSSAGADACTPGAGADQVSIHDEHSFPQAFDRVIADILDRADALPGVSIAVVRGDAVVYARGFGHADLQACRPATAATRYYLKSATKSFLGAAAAVFDHDGRIELDAPIGDYLPGWKLPHGLDSETVPLRAFLTHTAPVYSGGLNYRTAFPGNLAEKDFVEYLSEYSEATDTRFQYSNMRPIVAAHAIGERVGANWRDYLVETVFEPAGMDSSTTRFDEETVRGLAQGYVRSSTGGFAPVVTKHDTQLHAAGGSFSTALDLARWVRLNLADGALDGRQVIPRRAIQAMHAPLVRLDRQFMEFERFAHGLGVYLADYEGDTLLHHFGGETHVSFMPDHDVGVVVLTNELSFGVVVTHPLATTIYDLVLGKPDLDARIERRLRFIEDARGRRTARRHTAREELASAAPSGARSIPDKVLAGDYLNPRLGLIEIAAGADGLTGRYGAMNGPLRHVSGDAFLADIAMWGETPLLFAFRTDADEMVLDWQGRVFRRAPDATR